jgi:hypothetical protein
MHMQPSGNDSEMTLARSGQLWFEPRVVLPRHSMNTFSHPRGYPTYRNSER